MRALGIAHLNFITPFFQLKSMQIGIRNKEKENKVSGVQKCVFLHTL